jgi:predicted nucleotidyltransferase
MFTSEERDHVRDWVLDLARSDTRVTAGALIGSTAAGAEDEWSDIDIGFGIAEDTDVETVLDEWTERIYHDLDAVHHWDLRSGSSIYRVFLLPNGLEIDVSVTPEQDFGARGPRFRTLFGTTQELQAAPPPDPRYLVGLGWHHVFHARSSIERGKPWRAEYWISAIRDQALALGCLRLGEEAYYARGVDRLPAAVTAPFVATLVRSLDETELRRALAAATECFILELEETDPALCARLKPLLRECTSPRDA